MDLGLKERVALVTGSSQGIGRAAAVLLGREGARVAVTYRDHRAEAEAVVDEIKRAGGQALAVALELASVDSVQAAARTVLDAWGRIDVLVNNAVQWPSRPPWQAPPFEELPSEEWRAQLRVNTEGPYAAIQAVLPSMRARGWGRIVNVSSGVAVDGVPGTGPYAAAKASLHGLTRTLSKELGPAGILVNVVMPGVTLTERMVAGLPPALREQREQQSSIRRLLPPEEVVPTIVFLCSAVNTAVTGEIIRASGGTT
jgi:NAD(P)-dependent dehydrogenase (short-subunit alcohol dehydrogenase family)